MTTDLANPGGQKSKSTYKIQQHYSAEKKEGFG